MTAATRTAATPPRATAAASPDGQVSSGNGSLATLCLALLLALPKKHTQVSCTEKNENAVVSGKLTDFYSRNITIRPNSSVIPE